MKTAIAATEIFARTAAGELRRLTIAVGRPVRRDAGAWACTVTIADVLPPTAVDGADSFAALARALGRVRERLSELEAEGWSLYRDSSQREAFRLDALGAGAPR
jgi:hypothetical protein